MPCEVTEEFGGFGHPAHVNLKEGKAILERGELLKELFFGEFTFRGIAFVFVVRVKDMADHVHLNLLSIHRIVRRLHDRSIDAAIFRPSDDEGL